MGWEVLHACYPLLHNTSYDEGGMGPQDKELSLEGHGSVATQPVQRAPIMPYINHESIGPRVATPVASPKGQLWQGFMVPYPGSRLDEGY